MESTAAPGSGTQQEWFVMEWGFGGSVERPELIRRPPKMGRAATTALFDNRDGERQTVMPPIIASPGLKLCFLPNVRQVANLTGFVQNLTDIFHIPRFFWENLGIEANGFFQGHADLDPSTDQKVYSSISRFLIKSVDQLPNRPIDYHWQYAAFATYWSKSQNGLPVAVVLCFDLYREQEDGKARALANNITRMFEQRDSSTQLSDVINCPLGTYSVLLATLLADFDAALWGFKTPVRDFEKNRLNGMSKDLNLGDRYEKMHELSRHIIHMSETFDVTVQTIEQISRFHKRWSTPIPTGSAFLAIGGSESSPPYSDSYRKVEAELEEDLLFHQLFFNNLKMRADAFEERLHNEIQLAFNWVAAQNSDTQQSLLVSQKLLLTESRNDGKAFQKTVAIASMTFLPASFLTGVFGMNVETFTGDTWAGMSWELGGVLIALLVSILLGNFILYLYGPARVDDEQAGVPERQLTRQLTGGTIPRASLPLNVEAPRRWTRIARPYRALVKGFHRGKA